MKGKDVRINIPDYLVDAIDKYASTDWKDGRDPSKLGALNAVAYIGERLVAELIAARQATPTRTESDLEAARKAHRHAAHVYANIKSGPKKAAAAQLERAGVAMAMALAMARMENG